LTCRQKRGGLFLSNESTTWSEQGYFNLGYSVERGYEGAGDYGFDSIALNDQIAVPNQIVGIVNYTNTWIGSLGLGITKTNFTNVQKDPFLRSLRNNTLIPSLSYGFTAGASYRLFSTYFAQELLTSLTAS
jgi:hypothetical protein